MCQRQSSGAHVAERGADAALRRDRVAARREHLGEARGREALLREAERRAQARAAGADDDDVVGVIDEFVVFARHAAGPNAIFKIAKIAAIDKPVCASAEPMMATTFGAFRRDVVFDHDLHAEIGVIADREHEQDQHHAEYGRCTHE